MTTSEAASIHYEDVRSQARELAWNALFQHLPIHFYWMDKGGTLLGCNNIVLDSLGISSMSEFVGKHSIEVVHETAWLNSKEVMDMGEASTLEEVHIEPDGKEVIYLSVKSPIFNDAREVIGLLGVSIDITEKKLLEKELRETQEKLQGMTTVSATIAHELRTPLRAISSAANGLKKYLPTLLEAYHQANKAKLPVSYINPMHYNLLNEMLDVLDFESRSAFTVIDMLLTRLKEPEGVAATCSISHCIEETLRRYPFNTGERERIHWQTGKDFFFQGNELLMIHVFFNLLKNALYFTANQGDIQIWLDADRVHFKDTGCGIEATALPHVFDQFFSKTLHGTGLGLSFCKTVMQSIHGDIICHSEEGKYTEFVLNFPSQEAL